ncbi:hemin receptor [Brucella gallinifaecis]|uniref:hemin receptor n=1 Tax=Brucella gallinifaecis TaxID=215590 RepID=UPI002361B5A0|nr:hemin receptor [Brucella gallinifaecis]
MIGPHNENELELMLSGDKRMARFTVDLEHPELAGDNGFAPYVAAGKIHKFVAKSEYGPPSERRYYFLEGEEWRVKTSELVWQLMGSPALAHFTPEDLHRLDGWLLGYTQEDINDFIEQLNKRQPTTRVEKL